MSSTRRGERGKQMKREKGFVSVFLPFFLFLSFVSFFPTPPILLSSRNGHCRCYILAVASHNSEKVNSDFSTKTFHVLIIVYLCQHRLEL